MRRRECLGTRGFTDNRIKRTLRQIAAFECNRGHRDCNYRDGHFVLSPFRAPIDPRSSRNLRK
jgi:hypothetical protein